MFVLAGVVEIYLAIFEFNIKNFVFLVYVFFFFNEFGCV